jgi:DNA polymerase-3 subunit epsilon
MLMEELARVGLDLDVESRNSVDVQAIFFAMEKRTLEAAYKFYCDKELIDAHSASADINATYEVLLAQLDRYKELENTVESLANQFNNMADFVDNQRRFKKVGDTIVLNFGKHKDKSFQKINQEDPGYFRWMYNADFGEHTKIKLKQICEELGIKL